MKLRFGGEAGLIFIIKIKGKKYQILLRLVKVLPEYGLQNQNQNNDSDS